jgi:peptidoglycan hydrolase-like protein with peptidoglycan-binding domain
MRRLVFGVALILVGVGAFWAGRVTLTPAERVEVAAPDRVTTQVTEATIGRSLTFMVSVTQPFQSVATNSLEGVVTEVAANGTVESGDALFTVAGQRVTAIEGQIPLWRPLAFDVHGDIPAIRGDDVKQVQEALAAWGFSTPTDGRFAHATHLAVRAWQTATDQPVTGEIPLGTVLAIPTLPATVRMGDQLVVGDKVSGGEHAVFALVGDPEFALVLGTDQANLIPDGAAVDVRSGDFTWPALVTDRTLDENSMMVLSLTAPDGGLVCGEDCATLAGTEHSTLMSTVHVVPQESGPGVPVAAIRTNPQGEAFVESSTGTQIPVTVRTSGDGIALVEGVDIGTEILVVGNAAGAVSDATVSDAPIPDATMPDDEPPTPSTGEGEPGGEGE